MRATRAPADFLLSTAFLVSLGVILVNDFVLKDRYPGIVSGLASDIAGMVFFPIVLVALAELVALILVRRFATPRWFVVATIIVASAFVVAKFTGPGQEAAELLLGDRGVVSDPLDLLALLALPVPILVGRRWRGGRTDDAPAAM